MKKNLLFITLFLITLSCSKEEQIDSLINNLEVEKKQEFPEGKVSKYLVDGDSLYLTDVGGLLLFEGDIVVGETNTLSRSASLSMKEGKWPDNIVYYEFAPNYTTPSIVMAAINHWQEKTNIIFLPRNGQKNYIIFYSHDSLTNSEVGMKNRAQYINLSKRGHFVGNVIHEIGHALGFHHEHSRPDRDNYVTIHWDNITPKTKSNFEKRKSADCHTTFDFNSIMLYDSYAGSSNNKPTITKKDDGSTFNAQRYGLSAGDIIGANTRYPYYPIYGHGDAIPVPADYDGDGKIDLSVKTADGYWFIDYAYNGFGKWDWISGFRGDETAIPVPADYDGDGKADLSVKTHWGYWYIDYSANGFNGWDWMGSNYGDKNAIPVPADYDGDGKADLSIKNQGGYWYIDYAADGFKGWNWSGTSRGDENAIPVPADYDGDGKVDLSVKNQGGYWYIDYAANGFNGWDWSGTSRGDVNSHPVPADYDGDGKADLSVKTDWGYWYIDYSANGFNGWDWVEGNHGDIDSTPVPADYNGDGHADLSIKTNWGHWYIDYYSNGFSGWDWMQ